MWGRVECHASYYTMAGKESEVIVFKEPLYNRPKSAARERNLFLVDLTLTDMYNPTIHCGSIERECFGNLQF